MFYFGYFFDLIFLITIIILLKTNSMLYFCKEQRIIPVSFVDCDVTEGRKFLFISTFKSFV